MCVHAVDQCSQAAKKEDSKPKSTVASSSASGRDSPRKAASSAAAASSAKSPRTGGSYATKSTSNGSTSDKQPSSKSAADKVRAQTRSRSSNISSMVFASRSLFRSIRRTLKSRRRHPLVPALRSVVTPEALPLLVLPNPRQPREGNINAFTTSKAATTYSCRSRGYNIVIPFNSLQCSFSAQLELS